MSYCQQCGNQKTSNSCSSCRSHVHGSDSRYTSQSQVYHTNQEVNSPVVVHNTLSPAVLNKLIEDKAEARLRTNSAGRPILYGIFQAIDPKNGAAVPFARISAKYHGTNDIAALFFDANKTMPLNQPVIANEYGRTPLYFGGGPIDITVEQVDSNGKVCRVVERIENHGGFVDGDFDLQREEVRDCVDLSNPLVRIYDQDNCNLPEFMVSPAFLAQRGNADSGLTIGTYSTALNYFECLGEEFACGTLVFGDTTGRRFRYDCENCTQTTPPDPETVDFNPDGTSECWTSLDTFSACIYEDEDYSLDHRLLVCNGQGENRLTTFSAEAYPIEEYNSGMQFLVNDAGQTSLTTINRQNLSVAILGEECLADAPANSQAIDILRLADGSLACIESSDPSTGGGNNNCTPETIQFPAFSPIVTNGAAGFTSSGQTPFTATAVPAVSVLDTAPPNTALFCFSNTTGTPSSHTVTFDFNQLVDDAVIWIRSSTGASSNFSAWSKAPDSVNAANNSVGSSSGEDLEFTNIDSETLTATMVLGAGQRVCLEVKTITTGCP